MGYDKTLTPTALLLGLNEHDQEFLLDCAEYETTITGWGSWMMSSAGSMVSKGLFTKKMGSYDITDLGLVNAHIIWNEMKH